MLPSLEHRQIAQEMVDKMVTGTGVTFPVVGPGGNGQLGGWLIEDAKPISIPEGLLEYGDSLNDEIWEGMGIPPEVARAEGTGAFAGRRVPQQAFYSTLQQIMQDVISDADEQIFKPLVNLNYGLNDPYEIECVGLMQTEDEEEQGSVERGQQGGAVEEEGDGKALAASLVFPQGTRPLGQLGARERFGNNLMFYARTG
jgi:hypothetical protein